MERSFRPAALTFEHAAITSNLNAAFRAAVGVGPCFVQDSARYLMPQDVHGENLGLFRADVFVSCASRDKSGKTAHFPMVVVEILSKTQGLEFTDKKDAYLGSTQLRDYIIINSLKRIAYRYSWKDIEHGRRLVSCDYRRGPVAVPSLTLFYLIDEIYAATDVPAILHSGVFGEESETEISLE